MSQTVRETARETVGQGLRRELVSESAIYGLILVSALLIIVGRGEQSSWETFVKVLGTVVVFWVAHVFAHILAQFSSGSARPGEFRAAVRHAITHSMGLLLAAIVPLVIILAGVVSLISSDVATWTALWVDVVLLGLLGYFGSGGWTKRPALRLAAATATALLGVAIMMLKALIH